MKEKTALRIAVALEQIAEKLEPAERRFWPVRQSPERITVWCHRCIPCHILDPDNPCEAHGGKERLVR